MRLAAGQLLTPNETVVAEYKAAGLTRREIADLLDVTTAAVKQRLHSARTRVRKLAANERASTREASLARYGRALSKSGKPVRFRPFTLHPGEA